MGFNSGFKGLMTYNLWQTLISYIDVSASECHPQEVFRVKEIQGQRSFMV